MNSKYSFVFLITSLMICGCTVNDNVKINQDSLAHKNSNQSNADTNNTGFNVKWLNERKDSFQNTTPPPLTDAQEVALEIAYQKELDKLNSKWEGKLAPDFTAINYSGKKVFLHDIYATKYVLLDFWASWCVPCREAVPFLKNVTKNYDSTLQMVSVTSDDSEEDWKEAIKKENTLSWINLRPEESQKPTSGYPPKEPEPISKSYGISSIPTWVLISKGGIVAGIYGNTNESRNKLKTVLDSLFSK